MKASILLSVNTRLMHAAGNPDDAVQLRQLAPHMQQNSSAVTGTGFPERVERLSHVTTPLWLESKHTCKQTLAAWEENGIQWARFSAAVLFTWLA
eukprot:4316481-Amphidinium_carterae.1